MPPLFPPPDGVNSAAAAMSLVARFPHVPNAFAWVERNAVWKAGVAYSELHPLVVAPELSFHTTSVYPPPAEAWRLVPPTLTTSGADPG